VNYFQDDLENEDGEDVEYGHTRGVGIDPGMRDKLMCMEFANNKEDRPVNSTCLLY
jgi:hypothetical protein